MTPKPDEKQITVNLDSDWLKRLDNMAKHAKISRHRLISNLLTAGIPEIEKLEHIKLFQLAILVRDIKEGISGKKARQDEEKKLKEMPIPIRIDQSLVPTLDRLAKRADLTRHHLARNIITVGLEELECARRLGLTHIMITVRDIHELFAKFLEDGTQGFYGRKEVT